MPRNDVIHASNRIFRLIKARNFDVSSGKIKAEAFKLAEDINETYLSCTWYEFRNGDIQKLIEDIRNRMVSKKLSKQSLFSLLKIQDIKDACQAVCRADINVKHLDETTSYSGIFGINDNFRQSRNIAFKANKSPIYDIDARLKNTNDDN